MVCNGTSIVVHRTSNQAADAASSPAGTAVEAVVPALPDPDAAVAEADTGAEDADVADDDAGDDSADEVLVDDSLPELHAARTIAATVNTPKVQLRFMAVPFLMGVLIGTGSTVGPIEGRLARGPDR